MSQQKEKGDSKYTFVLQPASSIGVPDRGAGGSRPLGFGKLVKFGQMRWEIRAFRGLNFSR